MEKEQWATGQSDSQVEYLHLLTTDELTLMMTVMVGYMHERGLFQEMNWHQGTRQKNNLGKEFDEIDNELDRAKIQRWLIVVLNVALSILIEMVF